MIHFIKTFSNYVRAFFQYYIPNYFISRVPIYRFRHLYYRFVLGIQLGNGSSIHMGAMFNGCRLRVGVNSVINRNCQIDCRGDIIIGDNVSVSPDCCFITGSHIVDSPGFDYVQGPIILEDYVWVGTRAIILPNVVLGKGAVIASGAVVTKDVKPFTIVGGVPAREIGIRSKDLDYSCNYMIPFG